MSEQSRVNINAFKIVMWLMWTLAILSTTLRTSIVLHEKRRLFLDDGFLLFAALCLTAGTGFLYTRLSTIYAVESLVLNPHPSPLDIPADFLDLLRWFQIVNWVYLCLTYTTIFFIKFAFLIFFRPLVAQIPRMIIYWKVVLGFTVVIYIYVIADSFITCPHLGLAALQCSAPSRVPISFGLGVLTITIDIVTDIAIIAIPFYLLWKVKFTPQRKLGLLTFLGLQIFMILMAIVRVSGFRRQGAFDNPWIFFWQQIEACVSVTMLSLTAFRSYFIGQSSRQGLDKSPPWYSSQIEKLRYRKRLQQQQNLPSIPSATLTGMSVFISDDDNVSNTTSNNHSDRDLDNNVARTLESEVHMTRRND